MSSYSSFRLRKGTAIYFDTNCFIDLIQQRSVIPRGSWRRVRRAVESGRVRLLLSTVNLEEMLPKLAQEPNTVRSEILLMARIADKRGFVRPPDQLVKQAVQESLYGVPVRTAFDESEEIWEAIESIQTADFYRDMKLLAAIHKARPGIQAFRQEINDISRGFIERCREESKCDPGSSPLSFPESWHIIASSYARDYAKIAGCRDDLDPGAVAKLLSNRCIRMGAGHLASTTYDCMFKGRGCARGDIYDNQHALLASAADVLVTRDARFLEYLIRIPELPITVLSTGDFLQRL